MRQRHYHVTENTPGYLPENVDNPAVFSSKRSAQSYAYSLAQELREEGYRVSGSEGDYYAELSSSDLGRAIETTACDGECE